MSARIEKLKAKKLSELTPLTVLVRNKLTKFTVKALEKPPLPDAWTISYRQFLKAVERYADEITVADVMAAWEKHVQKRAERDREPIRFGAHRRVPMKRFMEMLIDRGMTRQDWYLLPRSAGNVSFKKREWLDKPIVLLNVFSHKALELMLKPSMTVRELLELEICWRDEKGFHTSLYKARDLLRRMGFKYEDGPFMQAWTLRKLVEQVKERCGLGPGQAKRIVESARTMGWGENGRRLKWYWDK